MNPAIKHFKRAFINNHATQALFLLHGTGGTEHDLIPLVEPLASAYNFVGLRGNVSEHGLPRFFKRQSARVFDQESIKAETKKLAEFLEAWQIEHTLTPERTAFLGFSNGANMILAMMFYYPHLISRAVVLHPMLPFMPSPDTDLSGKQVLLTYGEQDHMVSVQESEDIVKVLRDRGADVTVVTHSGGHELAPIEITELRKFIL